MRAITAPRSSARRQDLYAQGRPAGLAWPGGLYAATLVRGYQTSVPHAMHVPPSTAAARCLQVASASRPTSASAAARSVRKGQSAPTA